MSAYRLVLLLGLLGSTATAQTADSTASSTLPVLNHASVPDLAHELVNTLGRPWAETRAALPAPDSSTIEANLGDVWWSAPGYPVDGFRAFIQRGQVESVTLDFSSDGPDIVGFARRLYDRLGSPRADGFYATDQTGYSFSLAIDPQAYRLTARVVPGQTARD